MSNARQLAANLPREGGLSNRNLIINGAMQVAQRGTSSTAMGYQTVDRWGVNIGDGTATKSQSTDAPSGFANSLSVAMTTAAGSITTYNYIHQYIEGNLIDQLAFGTADAKTITLSFYVKSSITGTWGGSIRNFVAAPATSYRSQSFLYTIDAANTWEHKTVTISGDTGGSGQWNTGSIGAMALFFDMGSVGLTQATGSWLGNNCVGATGTQTSFITTTNATWQLTGVQLEVGDSSTPFEHRSYGDELARCQRYYSQFHNDDSGAANVFLQYTGGGGGATSVQYSFPTTMRVAPTITYTLNTNNWTYSAFQAGKSFTTLQATAVSLGTTQAYASANTTWLKMDAEL